MVGYNSGQARAAALIGDIPGEGHRAVRIPMEDSAQIRNIAAAAEREFGRADILVNSAGFTRLVTHNDLESLDDDLIDAILAANVRGPFAMIRAFAPLLRRSRDASTFRRSPHLTVPAATSFTELPRRRLIR